MSHGINSIVAFAETVTLQSKQLFETFGFIAEPRQVYWFVWQIRTLIKKGIDQLIKESSANQISQSLTNIYEAFSLKLKNVFDEEISNVQKSSANENKVEECWEDFKVPIFELGFEAVEKFKLSVNLKSKSLMTKLDRIKLETSESGNQLVSDLSANYSSLLTARSKVNTYVSLQTVTSCNWHTTAVIINKLILDRRQSS